MRFTLAAALLAAHLLAQHPDHMDHHFDASKDAARFDDPQRDAWQLPDRVLASLGLRHDSVVADIGSGTGYFSVRLAKVAAKVFGSDIEPSMVAYLNTRAKTLGFHNLVSVEASATSPNLPEPCDVILIVDTYHHIGDRVTYFRALKKSLKRGGRIAIIDFTPESPEGPPKEFRFSADRFKSEMTAAGYRLSAQFDFLPRQNFLIFEPAA